MNYIKQIKGLLAKVEESSGQVNPFHKQQLHNSKKEIIQIVDHLQKQIIELKSEIIVHEDIQREGY